jgi:hypothetical protein
LWSLWDFVDLKKNVIDVVCSCWFVLIHVAVCVCVIDMCSYLNNATAIPSREAFKKKAPATPSNEQRGGWYRIGDSMNSGYG